MTGSRRFGERFGCFMVIRGPISSFVYFSIFMDGSDIHSLCNKQGGINWLLVEGFEYQSHPLVDSSRTFPI